MRFALNSVTTKMPRYKQSNLKACQKSFFLTRRSYAFLMQEKFPWQQVLGHKYEYKYNKSIIFSLFVFARLVFKTADSIFTKSSTKTTNGCNRKVKLLLSELCRGWKGGGTWGSKRRSQFLVKGWRSRGVFDDRKFRAQLWGCKCRSTERGWRCGALDFEWIAIFSTKSCFSLLKEGRPTILFSG